MTKEKFKEQFDYILDSEDYDFETKLSDIEEWDSLAKVSYIALARMAGKVVSAEQINSASAVGELYDFLKD